MRDVFSKVFRNLVFIDGIMDKWVYLEIIKNNLNNSVSKMGLNEFIYQQDNDTKHTSKVVKEYLELNKVVLLEWPSQS